MFPLLLRFLKYSIEENTHRLKGKQVLLLSHIAFIENTVMNEEVNDIYMYTNGISDNE